MDYRSLRKHIAKLAEYVESAESCQRSGFKMGEAQALGDAVISLSWIENRINKRREELPGSYLGDPF